MVVYSTIAANQTTKTKIGANAPQSSGTRQGHSTPFQDLDVEETRHTAGMGWKNFDVQSAINIQ